MNDKSTKSEREFLSRTDIEERTNHMLDYVLPDRGNDTRPPDLKKIVTVLESRYRVHFSFLDDLGQLPTGESILGMFTVDPLTIRVSSWTTMWSPTFERTLAHELGHLVLHRKMIGEGKFISNKKPVIDTAKQLRYRETVELTDLGWVEWQANEFSMCLILPRRYLQMLVCAVQMKFGIRRKLGTMYLDDQRCNKSDCYRIVEAIAELSGTKETLLWRRLRFLGILEDHQKKRSQHIFDTLDALFETGDDN